MQRNRLWFSFLGAQGMALALSTWSGVGWAVDRPGASTQGVPPLQHSRLPAGGTRSTLTIIDDHTEIGVNLGRHPVKGPQVALPGGGTQQETVHTYAGPWFSSGVKQEIVTQLPNRDTVITTEATELRGIRAHNQKTVDRVSVTRHSASDGTTSVTESTSSQQFLGNSTDTRSLEKMKLSTVDPQNGPQQVQTKIRRNPGASIRKATVKVIPANGPKVTYRRKADGTFEADGKVLSKDTIISYKLVDGALKPVRVSDIY